MTLSLFGIFQPGAIAATPEALKKVPSDRAIDLLTKHCSGEWDNLQPDDLAANIMALETNSRIFSSYTIDPALPDTESNRVWIITEGNRSVTAVLLPEEYEAVNKQLNELKGIN